MAEDRGPQPVESAMNDLDQIQEHQEVIGSDGGHVGTIDGVEGNRLKLTRTDSPDGRHHYIDASMVKSAHAIVHLNVPADEARAAMEQD